MVVLWWFYGGFVVVLWWFYGGFSGFMVVLVVVLWWCYGGFMGFIWDLPSGLIKHGCKIHELNGGLKLARNITDFKGPFFSTPCLIIGG